MPHKSFDQTWPKWGIAFKSYKHFITVRERDFGMKVICFMGNLCIPEGLVWGSMTHDLTTWPRVIASGTNKHTVLSMWPYNISIHFWSRGWCVAVVLYNNNNKPSCTRSTYIYGKSPCTLHMCDIRCSNSLIIHCRTGRKTYVCVCGGGGGVCVWVCMCHSNTYTYPHSHTRVFVRVWLCIRVFLYVCIVVCITFAHGSLITNIDTIQPASCQ